MNCAVYLSQEEAGGLGAAVVASQVERGVVVDGEGGQGGLVLRLAQQGQHGSVATQRCNVDLDIVLRILIVDQAL